jgi:hypothetical protein
LTSVSCAKADSVKLHKIKEINQFYEDTDKYTLVFLFNESHNKIHVSNNDKLNIKELQNAKKTSFGNIDFYITQTESGIFHAVGLHNGFKYTFQSAEYENIITMLTCLKGH